MPEAEGATGQSLWFEWAVRQALVEVGLTVAALVVPGTTAVVYRPQNATEGYVALTLAAALLCWQLVRLAGLRLRIDGQAIRVGRHIVRRSELQAMRWQTTAHAGRSSHQLLARVDGNEFAVCRATATDEQAVTFTARAQVAGLPLAFPPS